MLSYEAQCPVCGIEGTFVRTPGGPPRESFRCAAPGCGASLRYQAQAQALNEHYGVESMVALVADPAFRRLRVWEPGELGPFRRHFDGLRKYQRSAYWPDVAPGKTRDGLRCEDLMALTFGDESFDLVLTSDVFEHVRKPDVGFAEVRRVLKPGGAHVSSVPTVDPLRPVTRERVDTSGAEDVLLLDPELHNGHLTYNNFGADLRDRLEQSGFDCEIVEYAPTTDVRTVTFRSVRR